MSFEIVFNIAELGPAGGGWAGWGGGGETFAKMLPTPRHQPPSAAVILKHFIMVILTFVIVI